VQFIGIPRYAAPSDIHVERGPVLGRYTPRRIGAFTNARRGDRRVQFAGSAWMRPCITTACRCSWAARTGSSRRNGMGGGWGRGKAKVKVRSLCRCRRRRSLALLQTACRIVRASLAGLLRPRDVGERECEGEGASEGEGKSAREDALKSVRVHGLAPCNPMRGHRLNVQDSPPPPPRPPVYSRTPPSPPRSAPCPPQP